MSETRSPYLGANLLREYIASLLNAGLFCCCEPLFIGQYEAHRNLEVAQMGVTDFNSSVVVMMGLALVVSMSVPSGCEMERLPQAAQRPAVLRLQM